MLRTNANANTSADKDLLCHNARQAKETAETQYHIKDTGK
jgi:hypothetical protein